MHFEVPLTESVPIMISRSKVLVGLGIITGIYTTIRFVKGNKTERGFRLISDIIDSLPEWNLTQREAEIDHFRSALDSNIEFYLTFDRRRQEIIAFTPQEYQPQVSALLNKIEPFVPAHQVTVECT